MNLRRLGLFCLIETALAITPGALPAAFPPDSTPAAQTGKENADDTANPYSVIVERNIFHLGSPPPPPEPEKPKVELPVIKITGFVNIGNQRKVLFEGLPTKDKKEPTYYSLSEGEKSGTLELVKIHPSQDGVDVINDGTPVTLTVKDDSLAPPPPSAGPSAADASAGKGATPIGTPGAEMPMPGRHPHSQQDRSGPGTPGAGLIPPRLRRSQQ